MDALVGDRVDEAEPVIDATFLEGGDRFPGAICFGNGGAHAEEGIAEALRFVHAQEGAGFGGMEVELFETLPEHAIIKWLHGVLETLPGGCQRGFRIRLEMLEHGLIDSRCGQHLAEDKVGEVLVVGKSARVGMLELAFFQILMLFPLLMSGTMNPPCTGSPNQ